MNEPPPPTSTGRFDYIPMAPASSVLSMTGPMGSEQPPSAIRGSASPPVPPGPSPWQLERGPPPPPPPQHSQSQQAGSYAQYQAEFAGGGMRSYRHYTPPLFGDEIPIAAPLGEPGLSKSISNIRDPTAQGRSAANIQAHLQQMAPIAGPEEQQQTYIRWQQTIRWQLQQQQQQSDNISVHVQGDVQSPSTFSKVTIRTDKQPVTRRHFSYTISEDMTESRQIGAKRLCALNYRDDRRQMKLSLKGTRSEEDGQLVISKEPPRNSSVPHSSTSASGAFSRGQRISMPDLCLAVLCDRDWPGCGKTFTRESDMRRHRNAVHQPTKRFWCMISGCNRSEGFPDKKRPFPRKDKLDSHMRNIHYAALSPSVSSVPAANHQLHKCPDGADARSKPTAAAAGRPNGATPRSHEHNGSHVIGRSKPNARPVSTPAAGHFASCRSSRTPCQ